MQESWRKNRESDGGVSFCLTIARVSIPIKRCLCAAQFMIKMSTKRYCLIGQTFMYVYMWSTNG